MDRPQIHYEIHAQLRPNAPFVLQGANERRGAAVELAESLIEDGRALAVRVHKEALDPRTGEFSSITVFERGVPQTRARRRPVRAESRQDIACVTPRRISTACTRARPSAACWRRGWPAPASPPGS